MNRRKFLIGTGLLMAAPAIVRAASIMPVRAAPLHVQPSLIVAEKGIGGWTFHYDVDRCMWQAQTSCRDMDFNYWWAEARTKSELEIYAAKYPHGRFPVAEIKLVDDELLA